MNDRTCADCRYFRTTEERADDRIGTCRLGKVIGVFRDSMRACPSFSVKGDPNPPVVDEARRGTKPRRAITVGAVRKRSGVSPGALADALGGLTPDALKAALTDALAFAGGLTPQDLGRHWDTGDLELCPSEADLKPKSMPLEQFFHKLVMIRDNLRVMEQKLNSHAHLHDGERVDLHRVLNLCYGSIASMGRDWVPEPAEDGIDPTARSLLRRLVRDVDWDAMALSPAGLGDRWRGGRARYGSGEGAVDEPIERFYDRLLVLRDRLGQLEAQISAHPHIAPDEADGMGSYIRRCYGTLTTFNVLFRDRKDYFTSSR